MSLRLVDAPQLDTARLTLRVPQIADFEPFAAFAASERSRFVRPADYDRAKAWRGFGHMVGHWLLRGFGLFAVVERASGRTIGMVGPWFPEGWPEHEIGWTLYDGAEGKGYAFEAAKAARAWAFAALGWPTAVSYIDPANHRSIALAERLGAQRDPAAGHPGETPVLVFRHPRPEVL